MKPLNVGIIGAGGIVRQRHMPGLAAMNDVKVVAVANASEQSARAFAKEYEVPHVETDWRRLIERSDIDIVWIGAPPYLHAPAVWAALENGKHVFCQARMAMNLAEARTMLEAACGSPDLVTMLCPPPHGMRYGKVFCRLLQSGVIGRPLHFRLQSLAAAWTDAARPAHFRQRVEQSGQNMLTVGIYAEVLNKWFGLPVDLSASLAVAMDRQQGEEIRVPDIIHLQGTWPGGLKGVCEWSGVARHAPGDRLEVYGSEGTLIYDFTKDEVWVAGSGDNELKQPVAQAGEEGAWTVEQDFIEAVRHGGRPEPSFATGVNYMRVLDAIHRSAVEKQVVRLDETPVV